MLLTAWVSFGHKKVHDALIITFPWSPRVFG